MTRTINPPATVTRNLLIEVGSDITIYAVGTYSTENGELVSVCVNGYELQPGLVSSGLFMLTKAGDVGHWDDDLDPALLQELIDEAAYDFDDEGRGE